MSALWTSLDAQAATGGQLRGASWSANGVSIDTRTLQAGDLFVALSDVRDGHDFVVDALTKGAAAALVSRVPTGVSSDAPLLIVDDVLAALSDLGKAGRARTEAKVIAITGSAGKTSTKEMLRHVLTGQGRTHAAEASYNNHWGVPLTLARMPADTEFAIIEIGMSHPGEIAPLSLLARPHIAIVTTVAPAHLESFDDIEGIAREKSAIFQGLEPGGVAIFNADLPASKLLRTAALAHAKTLWGFGVSDKAEIVADQIILDEATSIVRGHIKSVPKAQPFLFKIGAPGRHFAMNALAAMIAARSAGADWDIAACDIAGWQPPKGRGTRETLPLDPVEDLTIELIDDAFNANPASMAAAFEVLVAIPPRDGVGRIGKGRRIAILGDMLELGPEEAAHHAALADHPVMQFIHRVDCVGSRMKALFEALPQEKRGRWTATAEDMVSHAHHLVDAGDVVLVKGSKGSKVSLVVDALRKLGNARGKTRQKDAV